jgi:hypothetical protein
MAKRAGRTEKISISVDHDDLAILRKRAKRLHGGNLSAVIADAARLIEEEEGRQALLDWLGDAARLTDEDRARIDAEWRGPAQVRHKRSE